MPRQRPNDLVEAQVAAARARGEFDQLEGRGQPLQLNDLDHLRPEQRFEALLMRSCGEVPAQLALVRDIRALRARLPRTDSEQEREHMRASIREKFEELQTLLRDRPR